MYFEDIVQRNHFEGILELASFTIPSQLYEAIKMKDRNDKTLQLRVVQEIKKDNLEN
jgi:hypothetical protein